MALIETCVLLLWLLPGVTQLGRPGVATFCNAVNQLGYRGGFVSLSTTIFFACFIGQEKEVSIKLLGHHLIIKTKKTRQGRSA